MGVRIICSVKLRYTLKGYYSLEIVEIQLTNKNGVWISPGSTNIYFKTATNVFYDVYDGEVLEIIDLLGDDNS